MPFFQNVFDQEYQGYLVLGDRKLIPTFKVAPNKNFQSKQVAWNVGPYDFSEENTLEFNFSWDSNFKNWASVPINIAGSDPSATKPAEIVQALNANPMFSSNLVASVLYLNGASSVTVSKNPSKKQNIKFYFGNSGAEKILKFNKNAGVAELPEYFNRHTIENSNNFEDSLGMLIRLDEGDSTDQQVIIDAGFDPASMQEDWQLIGGRSGIFTFKKMSVDSDDRVTEIIEYSAGSRVGNFAKKTQYRYSGSNKNPDQITEIPYVLTSGDLIDPRPNIRILINDNYVDYQVGGGEGQEPNNLLALMDSLDISYSTFTSVSYPSFSNFTGKIIIPELEESDLNPDLTSETRSTIENFVDNGGTLIMFEPSSGDLIGVLNAIFNFSLSDNSADEPISLTEAGSILFPGESSTIPTNDTTNSLDTSTLPPNSVPIYEGDGSDQSVVTMIPYGNGKIYVLGWDWYSAAPVGAQNGGWNSLLEAILKS